MPRSINAVFKTYGRYLKECNLKEHFIHIKLGQEIKLDHDPEPNWSRTNCVYCGKPVKHEIPVYD